MTQSTRTNGDLTDMRRKLWQAVTSAEDVLLDDQSDAVMPLKAVHAVRSRATRALCQTAVAWYRPSASPLPSAAAMASSIGII